MAMLETAIKDVLKGDIQIAALVATRIRPLEIAVLDALPYLTYKVTSDQSQVTIDGEVMDYRPAEFEIGVYGTDYDDVMTLSGLVRDVLDQNGSTVSGIEFAPISFDDQTDVEETTPDGEEKPVSLRVQTYKVLYRRTA